MLIPFFSHLQWLSGYGMFGAQRVFWKEDISNSGLLSMVNKLRQSSFPHVSQLAQAVRLHLQRSTKETVDKSTMFDWRKKLRFGLL